MCLIPRIIRIHHSLRAFSISEGMESCYAIHNNKLVSLSTQQFISCDRNPSSYGCQGGTLGGAVDWLMEVRLTDVELGLNEQ